MLKYKNQHKYKMWRKIRRKKKLREKKGVKNEKFDEKDGKFVKICIDIDNNDNKQRQIR